MQIYVWLLLMFFVNVVSAGEYPFVKKVNTDRLQTELTSNGFNVLYIYGDGIKNVIVFDALESKNPQAIIDAHIYIDFKARLEANKTRMIVLAKKWVVGTITLAEKDELIKRFIISSLILEEMTD